jgi:hypothetical protein
MTHRLPNDSQAKAAISVTEMAKNVGLSVNHFRSLCKRGVFPMPSYSTHNKRPFFDIEAQQVCLQVRQTNIGHNGAYVLFYGPRQSDTSGQPNGGGKHEKPSERAVGLAKSLKHLGLDVTAQQVEEAAAEVFEQGLPPDDGAAIRALFSHFKRAKSG